MLNSPAKTCCSRTPTPEHHRKIIASNERVDPAKNSHDYVHPNDKANINANARPDKLLSYYLAQYIEDFRFIAVSLNFIANVRRYRDAPLFVHLQHCCNLNKFSLLTIVRKLHAHTLKKISIMYKTRAPRLLSNCKGK